MIKVFFLFLLVDIATVIINYAIKKKWWKLTARLVNFKKIYLAYNLRKIINNV